MLWVYRVSRPIHTLPPLPIRHPVPLLSIAHLQATGSTSVPPPSSRPFVHSSIRPIRSLSYTPSKTRRPFVKQDLSLKHRDDRHSSLCILFLGQDCHVCISCFLLIRLATSLYSDEPAPRILHDSMHRTPLSQNHHHLYSTRAGTVSDSVSPVSLCKRT